MTPSGQERQVEGKRVALACQRCRQSKLKCSGSFPCIRCQKRSVECTFDERDSTANTIRRQSVPETTEHRKRMSSGDEQSASKRRNTGQDNQRVTAAPLTPKAAQGFSQFMQNRPHKKRRRWLYLGASSTWSFNVRVASIIQAHLGEHDINRSYQFSLDGDAYTVNWNHVTAEQQPDLSRLPSFDYAVYLINTVKYHLGGIFHIFDEEIFMRYLREFYADGFDITAVDRLWYTQYLLLLAFGKSLLHKNTSFGAPLGTDFFTRAMAVLPKTSALHEDPILAVEVLALIALYFHCLDMRQTAYSYIGQALRIALVEGMHTHLPEKQIGEKLVARCIRVWWTVYILDRTLSATVGAPTSVSDDHITSLLPSPPGCPTPLATLSLHVKLSRLVSFILTELYSANGSLESSYLAKTRSVLRHMAVIGEEMEKVIDIKFKSSLDTITRVATHLRLLYHQCIILAIRPLLLCLLQDTIKAITAKSDSIPSIPPTVRDLVQTCTNSAVKTLKIIHALRNHHMLDTFLPFDLEYTCSASSVLIMVDEVLKCCDVQQTTKSLANKIVTEIVTSGNAIAHLRQVELKDLHHLASQLWNEADLPTGISDLHHGDMQATEQQRQTTDSSHVANSNTRTDPALDTSTSIFNQNNIQNHVSLQHLDFNMISDIASPSVTTRDQPSQQESNHQTEDDHQLQFQALLDDDTLTRFSTVSSQELANNFDLAHEDMLSLANQIDVDALDVGDDFDLGGDYHWLLSDCPS